MCIHIFQGVKADTLEPRIQRRLTIYPPTQKRARNGYGIGYDAKGHCQGWVPDEMVLEALHHPKG